MWTCVELGRKEREEGDEGGRERDGMERETGKRGVTGGNMVGMGDIENFQWRLYCQGIYHNYHNYCCNEIFKDGNFQMYTIACGYLDPSIIMYFDSFYPHH